MLDRGIDFHGIAFDHFLANPSAGVDTGHTSNLGAFRPAADFDLGKLVNLPGGNVHVGMTSFGLRSDLPQIITQAGDVLTGFQTTPATQTNLLSLLAYEQRLLGDRLSFEVGRTNIYNYFFLPNSLDPFTHYSTTVQVNSDFPSTPFPTWGGRAACKVTPAWYVQGGVFEDNYHTATNYGSRVFATNQSSGAQILAEVGQRSEFSNAPRPDAGPPANIAVYGSLDASVDKPQPIDMDAMLGVNFTGLIPGRPFDALGMQTKCQRLLTGPAGRFGPEQPRDGFSFELVGNIQLTPAIAFRPIVEYFVNPGNYYPPAPPGRPRDGFEAGFFAVVSLGRLLGTSLKPF